MLDLLVKTLSDLKEPAILWRLFIPFLASMILVSSLGYGLFGVFLLSDTVTTHPMVVEFTNWSSEAEQVLGSIPVVGALLLWVITAVFAVVVGILGILLGSYLIVLFAMIITGFMTDSLVKAVHDKHYPDIEYHGHGSFGSMLGKMLKFGVVLFLLFILTVPMLFIPLINIVWFWLLGFLFFRYVLVLDVGQVILSETQFQAVKGMTVWPPTLILALFFLLSTFPVLGFFAPVLGVIALAHYYFDYLSKEPHNVSDVN